MPIKSRLFKCAISCELDTTSFILQMRQLMLRGHTLRNSGRFEIWTHVWLWDWATSEPYLQCHLPLLLHSTSAQILEALYSESICFLLLLFSQPSLSIRSSIWFMLMISILGSPLHCSPFHFPILPHPLPHCFNYITSCSDILRGFPLPIEMKLHPSAGIQGPLCSDPTRFTSHDALPNP